MKIVATIEDINKDMQAKIDVKIYTERPTDEILRTVIYEAILRAMHDTNKRDFIFAMGAFADDALDALRECEDNEE